MNTIQFACLTLAFLGGVGVATVWVVPPVVSAWLIFISFILALVWRKNSSAIFAPHLLLFIIFLATFSLGAARLHSASGQFGNSILTPHLDEEISLSGQVVREPDARVTMTHVYLKVGDEIVLVSIDPFQDVEYGDQLTVKGVLQKPQSFTTDLGRTFDYPGYLKARGVEFTLPFAEIESIEKPERTPAFVYLYRLKAAIVDTLKIHIPEPQASLGMGVLLGIKSALPDTLEDNFRKTGIIHIVVLSGYNIMLVVLFCNLVLSRLLAPRPRALVVTLLVIAFALMVGPSATVVRASLMAILVLLAGAFGRRYDVWRALLCVAVLMVLQNPYILVYDIGFQLSFMATLGLIVALPTYQSDRSAVLLPINFKEYFVSTVATQIAVLPLLLYHIGEVSLVAVVVNMIVLPLVPLAMLLSLLTATVSVIPFLAAPVSFGAYLILSAITIVATWFGSLPFASIVIPSFPFWGVCVLYTFYIFTYLYLKRPRHQEALTKLNDWNIVEEEDSVVDTTKNMDKKTTPKTPVFFR